MAYFDQYADQHRWLKVSKEYNEAAKQLERQFAIWEEAQGKIEKNK
jgi:hypothetical protein